MSAIFGERLLYPQDAGPPVQLLVWGDEFYARRETTSGYTVVYDTTLGLYCYAQLAQGWFVSTRVPITKPPPPQIPPHLNEWPRVRRDRVAVRSRALQPPTAADDPDLELTFGPADGLLPGRQVSRGTVRGLTVLVQFPDQLSSVTTGEVDALLNQPGYALDGNRGSVRDFWLTMSNGKLDYSNDVVGPVTLSRPMSSYFVPEGTPSPQLHVRRADHLPDAVLAAQQRVPADVPRRHPHLLLHHHQHGPEPRRPVDRDVLPRVRPPAVPLPGPVRLRPARRRPREELRARPLLRDVVGQPPR